MNCPNCNAPLEENEQFCSVCGTKRPDAPVIVAPPEKEPLKKENLPSQFRVLSPWAYFGLQILYGIPVVGFIFLLIHTFSAGNLNRRSFARSYWCGLLIVGIVALVAILLCVVLGLSLAPVDLEQMFRSLQ